ncbi:MAG TPA: pantoate--beta-alanine ligase [Thermoleophilia bacterium]|nr:pantoate--beta-alanine ligase [Thermoleophilia bacterium]
MIVARTIAEARAALPELPRPLGFTPTMGALHEGHLSLVDAARARCAAVAASIFVNPTQFGRSEDLEKYPRDEGRDLGLFEARGVDVVFAPEADEMYPVGFATQVHVGGPLTETFEGASRPSHFDGVAVIVAKLLGVVRPDVLFLGQKDAQQLAIVRRLVRDLDLPVEVASVPTMREPDGLALSSRNAYLTSEQRAAAPGLHRALLVGAAAAESGEPADDVVAVTTMALRVNPEGHTPLDVEYVAVVDADSFEQSHQTIGPRSLLVAAVRLGSTRLIDNIPLTPSAYPAEDATT